MRSARNERSAARFPLHLLLRECRRPRSGAAFVLCALFAFATPSLAGPLFTTGFFGYDAGDFPYSVAAGDLNEDGWLDLAAHDTHGSMYVMTGSGDGIFTMTPGYQTNIPAFDVAIADLDRDGHLDGIAAGFARVSVSLGNGDATFAPRVNYGTESNYAPRGIVVADLNGDLAPDVITGDGQFGVLVFLGNGDGTLAGATHYDAGLIPLVIRGARINADAFLDLAISQGGTTPLAVMLGNGLGGFGPPTTVPAVDIWGVDVGDVTGDGFVDLVGGGSYCAGNGSGGFAAQVVFRSPQPLYPALADMNGDGKLDVLALEDQTVSVQLSRGNGVFDPPRHFVTGFGSQTVVPTDLNRDGKTDLLVATFGTATVAAHLGNGDGTLGNALPTFPVGYDPVAIAYADLTSDGIPDLVTADNSEDAISLLPGAGGGVFGARIPYAGPYGARALGIGDVDGDGVPDLATVSDWANAISIYRGDGVAGLYPRVEFPASNPTDLAFVDVNADTRVDVVVWEPSEARFSVRLAEVGTLLASPVHYPTGGTAGSSPGALAVADLNRDHRPDVVIVDAEESRVRVFTGLGDGTFVPRSVRDVYITDCVDLAVADLDGDGRLDVVVLGYYLISLHGNGDGTLGALSFITYSNRGTSVSLADLDRDGALDAILTQSFPDMVAVRLGNGAGGFGDPVGYGAGVNPTAAAAADVDEDGRTDLLVTNQYSNDISFLRHLPPPVAAVDPSPASQALSEFSIARVGPNPSAGRVRIEYVLPRAAKVRLAITDLLGREICRLADGERKAGRYEALWGGSSGDAPAPAGIYFVVYSAAGRTTARRIALIR